MEDTAAVSELFRTILNREPDQAGSEFYVGELAAGRINLQSLALDIANGVQGQDAQTLANKVEIGDLYTTLKAAAGDDLEVSTARALVSAPTSSQSSVQVISDALDAAFNEGAELGAVGSVYDGNRPLDTVPATLGELAVGLNSGSGVLFLDDGTARTTSDHINVGDAAGETGFLLISSAEASLTVAADAKTFTLADRAESSGVALVDDGASVNALYVIVGDEGRGELYVSGEGTRVTATTEFGVDTTGDNNGGILLVGNQTGSDGRLVIDDNALVSVTSPGVETGGPAVLVGYSEDSRGDLIIETGGTLQLDEDSAGGDGYQPGILIGLNGAGNVTVQSAGQINVEPDSGYLVVAGQPGATGSLTVTGEDSLVDIGSAVYISTDIAAGTNLPAGETVTAGGDGEITVGAGGTLRAGEAQGDGIGDIFIGENGTLRVEDGGSVEADVVNDAGGSFITGNSPGWAAIDGDFDSSGDLRMEFAGASKGEYDRLDVTGEAVLSGLVTLDFSLDEGLDAGDRFTIFEADEGLDMAAAEVDVAGLAEGLDTRTVVTETALQVELI
jgi:hypothetical protein